MTEDQFHESLSKVWDRGYNMTEDQLKDAIKHLQQLVKDQSETIATLKELLARSGRSGFIIEHKTDKPI